MVAVPPLGPSKHAIALATWHHLPLRVRTAVPLSDDELFELCQVNGDLRIERTADGEILVMPPTGGETGRQNSALTVQLGRWSELDGSGVSFDSSTGFLLPNGAERSPDAAWVALTRWQALTAEDRAKFAPICPDFVVELWSRSDELGNLRAKMEEYRACGARLGWLIDPVERRVHIYRPRCRGRDVECTCDRHRRSRAARLRAGPAPDLVATRARRDRRADRLAGPDSRFVANPRTS
jgi:Uma2 family endonuclease